MRLQSEKNRCFSCRNHIPKGVKFCPHCGTEQHENSRSGKYLDPKQAHRRSSKVIIVLCILVALLGISTVFFCLKAMKPEEAGVIETIDRNSLPVTEETQETIAETDAPTESVVIPEITETVPQTVASEIPAETQSVAETTHTQEVTGIVSAVELKVRSGPGVGYNEVARLNGGETVTIYEQETANGTRWGNIGYGWVSMDYIELGQTNLTQTAAGANRTGTVLRSSGGLNVRSGPGTTYNVLRRLQPGEAVTILAEQKIGDRYWGQIGDGWVAMEYIVFGVDTSVAPTDIQATDDLTGSSLWTSADRLWCVMIMPANNSISILVEYHFSPSGTRVWQMSGECDEHSVIRYSNGVRTDYENGTQVVKYSNGEGALNINGSTLEWHETMEQSSGVFQSFIRTDSYQNPYNSNNGGSNQSGSNSGGQTSDEAIYELVLDAFKREIRTSHGYTGAAVIYHGATASNKSLTYNSSTNTYKCEMIASYWTNIFDIWGTSKEDYYVSAEIKSLNGNWVVTAITLG